MNATNEKDAPRTSILDDVKVEVPSHAAAKTKKYVCRIRKVAGLEQLEFQIGVGPVTFCTETFEWEGKGEHAKQIFKKGAVYDLSDAQVEEIKAKIAHRYLRKIVKKGSDGTGVVTGVMDIDASDGGDAFRTRKTVDGKPDDGLPRRVSSVLRGDETPLKALILMQPCYDNPRLGGRTVTVEDLKRMLAEAEAEEKRETMPDGVTFEDMETGKGGKSKKEMAGRAAERDPKLAARLTTTDGKRPAEGGFIPG